MASVLRARAAVDLPQVATGPAKGYGATLKSEGDNDDEFGFFTIVRPHTPAARPARSRAHPPYGSPPKLSCRAGSTLGYTG